MATLSRNINNMNSNTNNNYNSSSNCRQTGEYGRVTTAKNDLFRRKQRSLAAHRKKDSSTDLQLQYQEALASLERQRQELEVESDKIYLKLTTPILLEEATNNNGNTTTTTTATVGTKVAPPIGLHPPIVDANGQPRTDIDMVRAQMLQQRYHLMQNDLDALMEQTEELLEKIAESQQQEEPYYHQHHHQRGGGGGGQKNGRQGSDRPLGRRTGGSKAVYDVVSGKWVCMHTNSDEHDNSSSSLHDCMSPGGVGRVFPRTIQSNHSSVHSQLSGLTDMDMSFSRNNSTCKQQQNQQQHQQPSFSSLPPFARVDVVADDSPADVAGLHEEDLILQFGSLDYFNHDRLTAIADLVTDAAEEHASIQVIILRRHGKRHASSSSSIPLVTKDSSLDTLDDDLSNTNNHMVWGTMSITLFPKRWRGRGLIGCHLVPCKEAEIQKFMECKG